ncbi:hypothetical protein TNCV_4605761 [Trichonephila clavipes]|nr:hypothetical protein TNCV_4605761 [Trichonephila clavipes]
MPGTEENISIDDSVSLTVGRVPLGGPAKIIDFPEKESVIKGRSLNLHCKAQGFPSPVITWYIGKLMFPFVNE